MCPHRCRCCPTQGMFLDFGARTRMETDGRTVLRTELRTAGRTVRGFGEWMEWEFEILAPTLLILFSLHFPSFYFFFIHPRCSMKMPTCEHTKHEDGAGKRWGCYAQIQMHRKHVVALYWDLK